VSVEDPSHPLLQRQLRRIGLDAAGAAPPWRELLARVARAYREHDEATSLLEHSQQLASDELLALADRLQAERDSLEARVAERTAALRVSEARLAGLLSLSADWIWEQDADGRFTYFSDGLHQATGIDPATLLGQRRQAHGMNGASAEAVAAYEQALAARQPFRDFTYDFTRADGSQIAIRISGFPVLDEEGRFQGWRGIGRDVTALTEADRRVAQLASTDTLTGLPNRNQFAAELDLAIARAHRDGRSFALCFIDLDRFKTVNDTLGHAAGDELLRAMARRLQQVLRGSDFVARLGGDEFVVLLDGVSEVGTASAVAEKLLQATVAPVVLRDVRFELGASLGLALFPRDGSDAATLLQHADAAMYDAKNAGGNALRFYTPEMADSARAAFELESALRLALAREELRLHYQPKRQNRGLRGAGPLAAPDGGPGAAGRLHPAGRGAWTDRGAGPLGAQGGLPTARRLAGRRAGTGAGGRERVGPPVRQRHPAAGRALGTGRFRGEPVAADARAHREHLDGRPRTGG
jgi:diguanylate cyclase (GGDEF)-like protein/PAS domain S-box-containing protein